MVGGKFFKANRMKFTKKGKKKDSDEIVFPCKRQHGKFYGDLSCNLFESWHTSNLRSSKAKNRKLVI